MATLEDVVALAPLDKVEFRPSVQPILTKTTKKVVDSPPTANAVVTAATKDAIVTSEPDDYIPPAGPH